jgi:hypothetical protein
MVHSHIQLSSSWTSCVTCLVAVSCRIDLQSASSMDGLGHHVHRTWIRTITVFSLELPQWSCSPYQPAHFRRCKRKLKLLLKWSQMACHVTADNFVVRLQRVYGVEGSNTEHVFWWRTHAHKFSMKVNFHSDIIWFFTRENYEYTVYRKFWRVFPDTLYSKSGMSEALSPLSPRGVRHRGE